MPLKQRETVKMKLGEQVKTDAESFIDLLESLTEPLEKLEGCRKVRSHLLLHIHSAKAKRPCV